jgi:hypothetical protein
VTRPWIRDRRTALVLGYGLSLLGVFVLRDAYEHRNKARPLWSTFIPGG